MKKISNFKIVLSAIFTAIILIISQFSIVTPIGIPITFQVFAIALAGYVLGAKLSIFSVLCYLILGLVGIPVFSGFMGGAQYVFGLTGGFIFGFIPLSFFCGLSKDCNSNFKCFIFGIIGLFICHLFGIIQYIFITDTPLFVAFISISFPYFFKDLLLVFLALIISTKINKYIKLI